MPETSRAMTLYWEIWFLVSMTAFLVPELWALFSGHSENTLSENIWRAEKLIPGQGIVNWTFFHFAFTFGFSLLAVWLSGHFGWGWWAGGLKNGHKA